jgi:hypothetical protein
MYKWLTFLWQNWQPSFHLLLFSSEIMWFCVTQKFDSDWSVFAKNFIHAVVTVMVAMAVDYPLLCVCRTNINILLFSGNNNKVITRHLLFILDCRWSNSQCVRCIHMNKECSHTVLLQSVHHGNSVTESLVQNMLHPQYSVQEHKE